MNVYEVAVEETIDLTAEEVKVKKQRVIAKSGKEAMAMVDGATGFVFVDAEKAFSEAKKVRWSKGLFRFFQPNDKDEKCLEGDCSFRALCKMLDKSWLEVFDELVAIAREIQTLPNSKTCWNEYLNRNGFVWHAVKVTRGSKRPTVESFTQEHTNGRYILQVSNHLVASVNGLYYDTWNSGFKPLYGWYEKGVNNG